jgi:hypothetical protein
MEFGCKVAGSNNCCTSIQNVELKGACDHVEMGHLTAFTKIQPAVYDEKQKLTTEILVIKIL